MNNARKRKEKTRCYVLFMSSRTDSRKPFGNSGLISPVDSALIQVVFTTHRIEFRDEKAYRFLNISQLKSQSFVTLLLLSCCPLSPFSSSLSDPRPPTLFLAFAFY